MGIVSVARFAAWLAGVPYVTMTSTLRRTYSRDLPRQLRLGGVWRGEEQRTRASEERAAIDHWVSPQVFCACGLYGECGKQIGSM